MSKPFTVANVSNWVRATWPIFVVSVGAPFIAKLPAVPRYVWFGMAGFLALLSMPSLLWGIEQVRAARQRDRDRQTAKLQAEAEAQAKRERDDADLFRTNALLAFGRQYAGTTSGVLVNECNMLAGLVTDSARGRVDLAPKVSLQMQTLWVAMAFIRQCPDVPTAEANALLAPMIEHAIDSFVTNVHNLLTYSACDQARANIEKVCMQLNRFLDDLRTVGYTKHDDRRLVSASFPSQPPPTPDPEPARLSAELESARAALTQARALAVPNTNALIEAEFNRAQAGFNRARS